MNPLASLTCSLTILFLLPAGVWSRADTATDRPSAAAVRSLLDEAAVVVDRRARTELLQRARRIMNSEAFRAQAADVRDKKRLFALAQASSELGAAFQSAWQQSNRKDAGALGGARESLAASLAMLERCSRISKRELAPFLERDRDLNLRDPAYRDAKSYDSRTAYAIAWSGLRLAQCTEAPVAKAALLEKSLETFEQFTRRYLDNAIVLDCFLGRALCLDEQGKTDEVIRVCEAVPANNSHATVFKQIAYLLVKAHLKKRNYLKTDEVCGAYFANRPADAAVDSIDLQLKLQWLETLCILTVEEPPARQFKLLDQADRIARDLHACGPPWSDRVLKLLAKYQADRTLPFAMFLRAGRAFEAKEYETAMGLVGAARKALAGRVSPDEGLLAQCHAMEAASLHNLGRHLDAAEAYLALLREFPKHAVRNRAKQHAVQSVQAAAEGKPSAGAWARLEAAIAALKALDPADSEVQSLDWLRGKALVDAGEYDRARVALGKVEKHSAGWPKAQYLIAFSLLTEAAVSSGSDARKAVDRAVPILDAIAASANRRRVLGPLRNAVLVAAQRYVRRPINAPERCLSLLARHRKMIGGDPDTAGVAAGLMVEALVALGRADEALAHLDALLQAGDNRNKAHALSLLLPPLESAISEAAKGKDAPRLKELRGRARGAYEVLVRHYENHPDAGANSALALKRRLAAICLDMGDIAAAGALYEQLAAATRAETTADVLRGLGLCRAKQGRYGAALSSWRSLAAGLPKRTPEWYEARYYTLLCLWESGQLERARRSLAQLVILYPDLGGEKWRPMYLALQARMRAAQ